MKHTLKITILLITIFLISQFVGLSLISKDMATSVDQTTGEVTIVHEDTAIGPRPEFTPNQTLIWLFGAIFIGTFILLMIVKYSQMKLWKTWYSLAVFLTISVSLGVLFKSNILIGNFIIQNWMIIFFFALVLTILKIYRPSIISHNLTEIFIYSGIAIIFVPLFNGSILLVSIMLILISIYDAYAVWKSKHMVSMAQFQTKSNLFAGFAIPYHLSKNNDKIETKLVNNTASKKVKNSKNKSSKNKVVESQNNTTHQVHSESKTAILGGGDITFPLIFSGVIMEYLVKFQMMNKGSALLMVFIISIFTTIALSALLFKSESGKFYPAMPFISAGCFVGLGIMWLVLLFL